MPANSRWDLIQCLRVNSVRNTQEPTHNWKESTIRRTLQEGQ